MNKMICFFLISMFLSGCISSAESSSNEGLETIKYNNESRIVHSFQFWGEYPSSISNTTVFNQSGLLNCEIKVFIHDEGNLTVDIHYGNETIFNESFRNETAFFSIPVSKNMTMDSYSTGFHNPEIAPVGDFFVVDCLLRY